MAKSLSKTELKLSKEERLLISTLVEYYQDNKGDLEAFLEGFAGQILSSELLKEHMHSVKWRMERSGPPARETRKKNYWGKKGRKALSGNNKEFVLED
jgi:hypothetical protein